jgi:hypothetical protein
VLYCINAAATTLLLLVLRWFAGPLFLKFTLHVYCQLTNPLLLAHENQGLHIQLWRAVHA